MIYNKLYFPHNLKKNSQKAEIDNEKGKVQNLYDLNFEDEKKENEIYMLRLKEIEALNIYFDTRIELESNEMKHDTPTKTEKNPELKIQPWFITKTYPD